MDKQWRFELSDRGAKLSPVRVGEGTVLGDMLTHPALYAAYPELRELPVRLNEYMAGSEEGYFDSKAIVLNQDNYTGMNEAEQRVVRADRETLGTLLHEVQHAIQRKEGFTGGSSIDYWNRKMEEGLRIRKNERKIQRLEGQLKALWEGQTEEVRGLLRERNRLIIKMNDAEKQGDMDKVAELMEQLGEMGERIEEQEPEVGWDYEELRDKLKRAIADNREMLPTELYRQTAGEIEARDVTARMGWTDEQRMGKMPAFDDDAVFAGNGRFSLREFADGTPYVEVDTDQDIFEGLTLREKTDRAEKYIRSHFAGRVIGEKNRAFVNNKTAKEYAWPANRKTSETIKTAKMLAAPELANLLDASQWISHAEDDGRHANAVGGWDDYRTIFVLNGEVFEGTIKIMNTQQGKLLYDITHIKRIEAGTYGSFTGEARAVSNFNSNTSIPQSSENDNGKLSLKDTSPAEVDEVLAENAQLRRTVGELQRQLMGEAVNDPKAVEELAKKVLAAYGSTYNAGTLARNLQNIFDVLSNGEGQADYNQAMQALADVSKAVIEKTARMDNELAEEYSGLRKRLRETNIVLTDAQRAEAAHIYGDYNTFRKRYMGRLRLANAGNGIKLTELWEELSREYPQFFPEDTSERDMAVKLADTTDALKPVYRNPYGMNLDQAASDLALELFEGFLNVPQVSSADQRKIIKLQEQLREIRREYREQTKAFQEMSWSYTEQQDRVKQMALRRRQNQERAQARGEITRIARSLSGKLLKPTNAQHIPAEMRGAVAEVLRMVDFRTNRQGPEVAKALNEMYAQYEAIARKSREEETFI